MSGLSKSSGKTAREIASPSEHKSSKVLDHKRKLEVSAWSIWGLKKSRYNSSDFGTVVVSTYAAAS